MAFEFPAKLAPLFEPHRYKVLIGGRGGAKSWGAARALLTQAAAEPLRVLNTREVQKSIRDSVHKLYVDQIDLMDLHDVFVPEVAQIKSTVGSEFLFAGLSDMTATSIKSFEGVDRVWVEEAQTISKRSWDILIPTIRKPGSEIWLTLNPELDTDETYVRFVLNPPPDTVIIEMNWRDNPWFPEVLERERQHAERTLPKSEYDHIWEGKTLPAVAGAIYAKEIEAAMLNKRILPVPYDPMLKVHVVFDLGWNDAMTIILAQRAGNAMMVIDYIEDSHRTYDSYSAELRLKGLNWGKVWMPHDGKHRNPQTGKSPIEVMQALGWDVEMTPDLSVENGIKQARMGFGQCYFDKDKTARLIECLKRYRRSINQQTNEPGAPLHDAYSHGADAFRYLMVAAEKMTNEQWGGALPKARNSIA